MISPSMIVSIPISISLALSLSQSTPSLSGSTFESGFYHDDSGILVLDLLSSIRSISATKLSSSGGLAVWSAGPSTSAFVDNASTSMLLNPYRIWKNPDKNELLFLAIGNYKLAPNMDFNTYMPIMPVNNTRTAGLDQKASMSTIKIAY